MIIDPESKGAMITAEPAWVIVIVLVMVVIALIGYLAGKRYPPWQSLPAAKSRLATTTPALGLSAIGRDYGLPMGPSRDRLYPEGDVIDMRHWPLVQGRAHALGERGREEVEGLAKPSRNFTTRANVISHGDLIGLSTLSHTRDDRLARIRLAVSEGKRDIAIPQVMIDIHPELRAAQLRHQATTGGNVAEIQPVDALGLLAVATGNRHSPMPPPDANHFSRKHNVHDSVIGEIATRTINQLKAGGNRATREEITNVILNHPGIDDRQRQSAMQALDVLGQSNLDQNDVSEVGVLQLVWPQVQDKKIIIEALADCVEDGRTVCVTGRISRMIATLAGTAHAPILRTQAILEKELLGVAARLRSEYEAAHGGSLDGFPAHVSAELHKQYSRCQPPIVSEAILDGIIRGWGDLV